MIWRARFDYRRQFSITFGVTAFVEADDRETAAELAAGEARAVYGTGQIERLELDTATPDALTLYRNRRAAVAEWIANVNNGVANKGGL